MATIYIMGSADPAYRNRLAHALRKRGANVVELAGAAELSNRGLLPEPDFLILEIDDLEPNEAFVEASLGQGGGDRSLPIIVVGRLDDPRAAESWRRRGALDFLSKTEPLDHVLGRLERILTRADRDHDFEELLSGLEAAEVEPEEVLDREAIAQGPAADENEPSGPDASGRVEKPAAPAPSRREEPPTLENPWPARMVRGSLGLLAVLAAAALVVFLGPVDRAEHEILSRAPTAITSRASPAREETVELPRPPFPAPTPDATPAPPPASAPLPAAPAAPPTAKPPGDAAPPAPPTADPLRAVPEPSAAVAETPPFVRGVRRAGTTRLLIDRAGALSFIVPWKDQDLVGGADAVGVSFSVLVDPRGWVEDVQVLVSSGNPTLDRMAAEALREASFRPALSHGAPVSARILQTMTIRRH